MTKSTHGRGKRPGLRARSKNARTSAPRITMTEREELYCLRSQVRRARECMEVNDPLNARDIFGPPLMPTHEDEGGPSVFAPAQLENEPATPESDDVYL